MHKKKPIDPERVPARITEVRKRLGLSQGEVAKTLKITRNTFAKYEKGEIAVGVDMLQKIADAMGTRLSILLLLPGQRIPRGRKPKPRPEETTSEANSKPANSKPAVKDAAAPEPREHRAAL